MKMNDSLCSQHLMLLFTKMEETAFPMWVFILHQLVCCVLTALQPSHNGNVCVVKALP